MSNYSCSLNVLLAQTHGNIESFFLSVDKKVLFLKSAGLLGFSIVSHSLTKRSLALLLKEWKKLWDLDCDIFTNYKPCYMTKHSLIREHVKSWWIRLTAEGTLALFVVDVIALPLFFYSLCRLRNKVKNHSLVVASYDIVRNDGDFFRLVYIVCMWFGSVILIVSGN